MKKSYAWIAGVGVAVFGIMLVVTPAKDRLQTGLAFALCWSMIGMMMVPAVRRTALNNKRASIIAGGVVILLGFLTLPAVFLVPQIVSPGLGAGLFIVAFILGLELIQLPWMSARIEQAVEAQKTLAAETPSPQGFDPAAEVSATLRDVLDHLADLARVSGPWLLLFCVPIVVILGGDWKHFLSLHETLAPLLLLVAVVLILASVIALMVAGIQWMRFVSTRQRPAWFAVPGKALWGWTWRWLIFGAVTRYADKIGPWVKAHAPGLPPWQVSGLTGLANFAILVLASSLALKLIPVALGQTDGSAEAWIRAVRLAGRKFFLGSAIILAPYTIASWLLDLIPRPSGSATGMAILAGETVLWLATCIVAATYLTRVYLRGQAAYTVARFS